MTVVEVFADIWCPFTHVGVKRFIERRDAAASPVRLRVRPWPLELVNQRPMDAAFIGEEIADLRTQAAPDLFAGFREDRFPRTTLPALALAEAAYGVDDATGEAVSLELRDALFEQGLDISRPEVLAALADRKQVPLPGQGERSAVEAALAEGTERGVAGSPHFFTPAGAFFCPALDIERVDGHLQIRPDPVAFDRFVDVALGL